MLRKAAIIATLALTLVFAAACLISCSAITIPTPSKKDFTQADSYADFIDAKARIGSEEGEIYAQVAKDLFRASDTPQFTTVDDALDALLAGDIDAVMASGGFARQLLRSDRGADFKYIAVPGDIFINESGPIFATQELRDEYNQWYEDISKNGTWDKVVSRWLHGNPPTGDSIPNIELSGENGTLKVADTGNYPPLSYLGENGEIIGFDIEMASLFAQHMGMDLKVTQMDYEDIIPLVTSGDVDMSACTYSLVAQRDEDLIFGKPSVFSQAVLIIPSNQITGNTGRK